jgi:hypothetical protein
MNNDANSLLAAMLPNILIIAISATTPTARRSSGNMAASKLFASLFMVNFNDHYY